MGAMPAWKIRDENIFGATDQPNLSFEGTTTARGRKQLRTVYTGDGLTTTSPANTLKTLQALPSYSQRYKV